MISKKITVSPRLSVMQRRSAPILLWIFAFGYLSAHLHFAFVDHSIWLAADGSALGSLRDRSASQSFHSSARLQRNRQQRIDNRAIAVFSAQAPGEDCLDEVCAFRTFFSPDRFHLAPIVGAIVQLRRDPIALAVGGQSLTLTHERLYLLARKTSPPTPSMC